MDVGTPQAGFMMVPNYSNQIVLFILHTCGNNLLKFLSQVFVGERMKILQSP